MLKGAGIKFRLMAAALGLPKSSLFDIKDKDVRCHPAKHQNTEALPH